jgi:fluoroacetyl-CoA thioesterase
MKDSLRPGITATKELVVQAHDAIDFMGPDVPGVLASPRMLLLMEHAARECVLPHLDPGQDTVGVGFEFEHCAASPIGAHVTATAELLGVQGRMLQFRIEARDEVEVIGRGKHMRAIVDVRRFAEKLAEKLKARRAH